MPFEPGKVPEGATPFQPGQSGNPAGKPVGAKNRSTIARKILEMKYLFADENFDKLKEQYPEIERSMTVEEIMTIVQVNKAVTESDHNSYKAVLDSAYGAPKQDIEGNLNVNIPILNLDPLSHVDNNDRPQEDISPTETD